MPVSISTELAGPLPLRLENIVAMAERILGLAGAGEKELSLLLTDDRRIAVLNRDYRKKDRPTNVLAFAMQEGDIVLDTGMLGDVVISLDTARREANEQYCSLTERVRFLLIHGILHLLGYDHERSETEARRMEQEQYRIESFFRKSTGRTTMMQLAVNVDHIATIRQARGGSEPDPVLAAGICELAGASGIVVHLREDRRHIQDRDVRLLRQTIKTKLNLEMGATEEIIGIALEIKPDMVTLVPEKRQELTTEGGLNVTGQKKKLAAVIERFSGAGIPVSLFVDPESKQIKASHDIGATFVEIHTGRYADATSAEEEKKEFALVADAAEEAASLGLKVNAGHGLNYRNTRRVAMLGTIEEISIGHAIVARAAFVGMEQAVREMLALLR